MTSFRSLSQFLRDMVFRSLSDQTVVHGIPELVRSDCGPQFCSKLFTKFAVTYEFCQTFSSPRFLKSNGEAEKAVQTSKNLLKKSTDP